MGKSFQIGCSACFAQIGPLTHPICNQVQVLEDSSHISWAVVRCKQCSLPMLSYFYEIVDWEGGHDLMYSFLVPLLEKEVTMLAEKYPNGWNYEDYVPYQLLDREPRLVHLPDNKVMFDTKKVIPGEPIPLMNKHLGYNLIASMFGKPAEELCGLYALSDNFVKVTLDSEGEFVVRDQATGADNQHPWEVFQYGRKLDDPEQQLH